MDEKVPLKMAEKVLVFTNDKYAKRSAGLCCWLMCAKRLGIVKDIRIYIAKMCLEPVTYQPGDVVVSNVGQRFELVVRGDALP